ncbi:MAG: hypothetical protein BRC41_08260 [Cyanobacteria bacterium QH_9_48_43]|nr:MAG: hypothetical protein BRC41_08260 [Cyanobacteria bacterium QH_9_48_43]
MIVNYQYQIRDYGVGFQFQQHLPSQRFMLSGWSYIASTGSRLRSRGEKTVAKLLTSPITWFS